jgi:hypothetical protein
MQINGFERATIALFHRAIGAVGGTERMLQPGTTPRTALAREL